MRAQRAPASSLASVPHNCGLVETIQESRETLATEYRRVRGEWHQRRASSLARPVRAVLAGCGRPWAVAVHQDGRRVVLERRCGLVAVCPRCARRKSQMTYARIQRALGPAQRDARAAWSRAGRPRHRERQWLLLTLTIPREAGDLRARYRALSRAWHRLARWLADTYSDAPGRQSYVRVREVTEGRDRLGHVHYHVVALLPRLDLDALHAAWGRATGYPGVRRPDVRSSPTGDSTKACARYVAKYVSKPSEGMESLAGEVFRAGYGQRSYTASRGLLAVRVVEYGWELFTVDSSMPSEAIGDAVSLALMSRFAAIWGDGGDRPIG